MNKRWRFWIDRGGTFTDIVGLGPDGTLRTHKLLSEDPARYHDAATQGIAALLGASSDMPSAVAEIRMGTTVATNALLERRGAPTVFVTTGGFGDCLAIGYQSRPDIFALNIQRPEPLYDRVIEVAERVSVDGETLIPLDEAGARRAMSQAFQAGLRSCAIALIHGHAHPAHERRLGQIAADIGFEEVALSSEVAPLIKLVSRGATTVLDAYLSPVLKAYVGRVTAAVGAAPLMFMQSSGGLVEAAHFRGKDSLLSGPAGGLVGAVEVGKRAGFSRLINFDMGGTSTDVSVYDGAFERVADAEVGGMVIRAPTLAIHTVAAGGGSIVGFDRGRFFVGPRSAGAAPGPACYRRGGPATITDCNVALGRVQARHFPLVFGAEGDEPLDEAASRRALAAVAAACAHETGLQMSAEAVARSCLSIAVSKMAEAIGAVTVQRGLDPAEYAMVAFGGAGGQHACAVAEALGVKQVVLHPMAGVLSALGMGLADVRVIRARSVEGPLSEALAGARALLATLEAEAAGEVRAQLGGEADVEIQRRLVLRYEGTDTPLNLPLDDGEQGGGAELSVASLQARFNLAHRRRFSFADEDRPLTLAAVEVEAIGQLPRPPLEVLAGPAAQGGDAPHSTTRLYSGGGWHDAPVYRRGALGLHAHIDGPAVILEGTSTTIIDVGWAGTLRGGALVLTRGEGLSQPPTRPDKRGPVDAPDPTDLELFAHRFRAIAEHMGRVLQATSHSVNIKERLDFSCALFDAQGQLVANAPHIPVHLGSMGESVAAIMRRFAGRRHRPGDAFAINDPYTGGTHLPDITVVSPVVGAGGEALFWVASRGHHADVGGISPGSMPPMSRHIDEEGVRLTGLLIAQEGRFEEAAVLSLLTSGPYPARAPAQNIADLKAQVAANGQGCAALVGLCERHGQATVAAYMSFVQEGAAEAVRRVIDTLKSGAWAVDLDDGARIAVKVEADRAARRVKLDFTGTSPQRRGNFNAPTAVVRAAVLYAFRTLVGVDIPLNAGCMEPVDLIIPPGSLLAPSPPAAVVAGNVETSQLVVDAILGAVGALAASQGTMNNLAFGNARHQYYETIAGGAGAGDGFDGASAVQTHMTNSRLTDPEILESRFPVRVEAFGIRRGSGGRGRYKGGDGVLRRLRFLETMEVSILSGRRHVAPFGLAGGGEGARGENWLFPASGGARALPPSGQIAVAPGDAVEICTPGGGGFGPEDSSDPLAKVDKAR